MSGAYASQNIVGYADFFSQNGTFESNSTFKWLSRTLYEPQNKSLLGYWTLDKYRQEYQPQNASLVGYWKLDGNGRDSSSYGYDLLNNGSTANQSPDCKIDGCFTFNGTHSYQYIRVPAYRIADGQGTIEAWVKKNNVGAFSRIFTSSDEDASTPYMSMAVNETGRLAFQLNDGSNTLVVGTANVTGGSWHHVAIVSDGSQYLLYVDGMPDAISGLDGANNGEWFSHISGTDIISLGAMIRNSGNPNNPFGGNIDEVAIYSYAKSSAEILQDYRTSQYHARDLSGNNRVGIAINGAGLNNTRCLIDGCAFFDGQNDAINFSQADTPNLTTSGTMEAWVYGFDNNVERHMLSIAGTTADAQRKFLMRLNPGGENPRFSCFAVNQTAHESRASATFDNATWIHYACTFNGTHVAIYKNGILAGINKKVGTFNQTDSKLSIGSEVGINKFWNGSIDEVAIYSYAKSASEIYADFKSSPYSAMIYRDAVAYYHLDENGVGNYSDSSGKGLGSSITGTVRNVSGIVRGAVNFTEDDAQIDLGDPLDFRNSNWSISFWSYSHGYQRVNSVTNVMVGYGNCCLAGGSPNPTNGIVFRYLNDNQSQFLISQNTSDKSPLSIVGGWHHHVGIYDTTNETAEYYFDGQLMSRFVAARPNQDIGPTTNLLLGQDNSSSGGRQYRGALDELAVYNKTLTASDVKNLYQRVWYDVSPQVFLLAPGTATPLTNDTQNTTLLLHFDDGVGTTARDSSPHINHGTISGAFFVNNSISGSALNFDGVDDMVTIPDSPSLQPESFTLSVWVNALEMPSNGAPVFRVIAGKADNDYAASEYYLVYDEGERFIKFGVVGSTRKNVNASFSTGTGWHHLAGTFDSVSGAVKLYIDGALKNQTTGGTITHGAVNLFIGKDSGDRPFNGTIDEVKIVNRSLSDAEIMAEYRKGAAGAFATSDGQLPLNDPYSQGVRLQPGRFVDNYSMTGNGFNTTLYLRFDDLSMATATDISGRQNHGNVSLATAVYTNDSVSGYAIKFDGVDNNVINVTDNVGTSNFTVQLWAKKNPDNRANYVIARTNGTRYGWYMRINSNTMGFFVHNSAGSSSGGDGSGTTRLDDGRWHHLTGVYNGSHALSYVDSILVNAVASYTDGNPPLINGKIFIGSNDSVRTLNGTLDEVRIINKSLTQEEIRQDYLRQATGIGLFGNSTASYLNYSAANNFNEREGTIEFWVKPEWGSDDGQTHRFFEAETGSVNDFIIVKGNDGGLGVNFDSFRILRYLINWTAGSWHHIGVTWNNYSSNTTLHLDGLLVNSSSSAFNVTAPSFFYLGMGTNSNVNNNHCNCTISDFRISQKALTANDINLSYSRGRPLFPNEVVLNTSNFNKNDMFELQYSSRDSENLTGFTFTSNSLTIQNTPPSATAIELIPAIPQSIQTLTCAATGSMDFDGDSLTYYYAFNSSSTGLLQDYSLDNTFTCQNDSARCNPGDTIFCQVVVFDGTSNSSVNRTSVFIHNSLPELAKGSSLQVISQQPHSETLYTNYSVIANPSALFSATDIDSINSNNLTYYYTWYKNGKLLPTKSSTSASEVLYFNFEEGEGATVHDLSGKGNNGRFVNASHSPAWVNGIFGSALEFDGSDMVNVTASSSLSYSTNFSVEFWFKPDTIGVTNMFLVGKESGGLNTGWDIHLNSANLLFRYRNTSSEVPTATSAASLSANRWYHVAVTFENSTGNSYTVTIYINGIPDSRTTLEGPISQPATGHLTLGQRNDDGNGYFDGIMDELHIYSRVLNKDEILRNYRAGAHGIEYWNFQKGDTLAASIAAADSSLLASWGLDEGQGNISYDLTGRFNGTLNSTSPGNATSGWTSNAVRGPGALIFDGNDDFVILPDATAFTFGDGSTDRPFSVSLWVYPQTTQTDYLIAKDLASGSNGEWVLELTAGNSLNFWIADRSASAYIRRITNSTLAPFNTNTWWHIVTTYDGRGGPNATDGMHVYVNGVLVDGNVFTDTDYVAMENTPYEVILGARKLSSGFDRYFTGKLDDVAIFNTSLSTQSIKYLYENGIQKFSTQRQLLDNAQSDFQKGYGSAVNFTNQSGNLTLKVGRVMTQPDAIKVYWPLDGNAIDSGTLGNHGTIGRALNATGRVGLGMKFDGLGAHINYTSNPLQNTVGTMAMWFKLDSAHNSLSPDRARLITDIDGYSFIFFQDENTVSGTPDPSPHGSLCSIFEFTPTRRVACSDQTSWPAGEWHHVATTWTTSQMHLYVDGKIVKTVGGGTIVGVTGKFGLGSYFGGGENFNGTLDEVVVYNVALSEADIKELYEQGLWQGNLTSEIKDNNRFQSNESLLRWNEGGSKGAGATNGANPYASASSYGDELEVEQGMVLLLHFNNNATPNVTDSTGLTAGGTRNGGLNCSATNGPDGVSGKFFHACQFDGVNDFVSVGDVNILDFGTSTDFTLEAWVKLTGDSRVAHRIITKATSGAGFSLHYSNTSNATRIFVTDGASYCTLDGNKNIFDGQWHHIAASVIRAGSCSVDNFLLYVDGVREQGSLNSAGVNTNVNIDNSVALQIGSLSGQYFGGIIDEVAIYNRSLSASEAMNHYLRGAQNITFQVRTGDTNGVTLFEDFDKYANGTVVNSTDLFRVHKNQGTVDAGTIRALGGSDTQMFANSSVAFGTWEFDFRAREDTGSAALSSNNDDYFYLLVNDTTAGYGQSQGGYLVFIENSSSQPNLFYLVRHDGVSSDTYLISSSWNTDQSTHRVKIVRHVNGTFEMYLDGVLKGTVTDTTYTSSKYVGVLASDLSFDNIRVTAADGGIGLTSSMVDWSDWAGPDYTHNSDPKLVLGLDFSEMRGNTTYDESRFLNNGTIKGADWSFQGKQGSALKFDGVDDFVNISHNDAFNFAGPFSVEAWIYPVGLSANWKGLVGHRNPDGGGTGWELKIHSTSNLFQFYDSATDQAISSDSVAVNHTWQHLAVTRDSSNLVRMYVNGVLQADKKTYGSMSSVAKDLRIGVENNGPPHVFNGTIDSVSVWNRTLTSAEILQHAQSRFTNSSGEIIGDTNRYIQYRAELSTEHSNSSPTLRDVWIEPATAPKDIGVYKVNDQGNYYSTILNSPASKPNLTNVQWFGNNTYTTSRTPQFNFTSGQDPDFNYFNGTLDEGGPVSYWSFDARDSNATHVFDIGKVPLHGVIVGGNCNATGVSGTGCEFFGDTGEYVNLSGDSRLSFGLDNMSFTFWVREDIRAQGQRYFLRGGLSGSPVASYLLSDSGGTVLATIQWNSSHQTQHGGGIKLNDGGWHFVAVSLDRSANSSIYIDGKLSATTPITQFSTINHVLTVPDLTISTAQANRVLNGSMDEVAIWNRSLSLDDAKRMYERDKTRFELVIANSSTFDASSIELSRLGVSNFSELRDFSPSTAEDDPYTLFLDHMDSLQEISDNGGMISGNATIANGRFGNGVSLGYNIGSTGTSYINYSAIGNFDSRKGSVELWIRPEWPGTTGNKQIFFSAEKSNDDFILYRGTNSDELRFWINNAAVQPILKYDISSWLPGEWHHVAVTWDNTTSRTTLHVDGAQVNSSSVTFSIPAQDTFTLGAEGPGFPASMCNCTLDELRISSIPRTSFALLNSTSYTLSSSEALSNGTKYWRVRTIDAQDDRSEPGEETASEWSDYFVLTSDSSSPTIAFVAPTPTDGSVTAGNSVTINANITDTAFDSCTLEIYNSTSAARTNYSMAETAQSYGADCSLSFPTQDGVSYYYRVFAVDLTASTTVTSQRSFLENSLPSVSNVSIGSSSTSSSTNLPELAVYDTGSIVGYAPNYTDAERHFESNSTFTLYKRKEYDKVGLLGYWKLDKYRQEYQPQNGSLLGYWKLDGNAVDASGYGNNGLLVAATSNQSQDCKIDDCVFFDGVNSLINMSDRSSLTFASQDFTVEAWVRFNSYIPNDWDDVIVSKMNLTDPRRGYMLGIRGTSDTNPSRQGRAFGLMGLGDSSGIHVYGRTPINDSLWHHVAITAERGKNLTIYTDGILENTTVISSYVAENEETHVPFLIGGQFQDSDSRMNGSIDEVAIYSYAKSASEILQDYKTSPYHARDVSGYGNDGIFVNVTNNNSQNCRIDDCVFFDGRGYINVSNEPNFDITDAITVEAWFRTTEGTANNMRIVSKYDVSNNVGYELTYQPSTDTAFWQVRFEPGSNIGAAAAGLTLSDGNWHHIAGTYHRTGGNASLYIDGRYIANATNSTGPAIGTTNTPLVIGTRGGAANLHFNGSIDEVAIYNRSKTGEEIYNDYLNSPYSALIYKDAIAYWHFDSDSFLDNAVSGSFDGTMVGSDNATNVTGIIGNALLFDGREDYVELGTSDILNGHGMTNWSYGAWFKPNGTLSGGLIIGANVRWTLDFGGGIGKLRGLVRNSTKKRAGIKYQRYKCRRVDSCDCDLRQHDGAPVRKRRP